MAPWDGEELLLYIFATPQVVSAVLVAERDDAQEDAGETPQREQFGSTAPQSNIKKAVAGAPSLDVIPMGAGSSALGTDADVQSLNGDA